MKWIRNTTAAVAALIVAMGFPSVHGQESRSQGQEPRAQTDKDKSTPTHPAAPSAQAARADAQGFINEMTIANLAEVQLGKTATEKSANADVKAYGQMMVKDHSQASEELKQIAMQLNVQPPTQLDQKHKDLADKLSKLQGAEFDHDYINAMVQGHQEVLGKLRARADAALPGAHGAAGEHPGAGRAPEGLPNTTSNTNKPVARDSEVAQSQTGRGATTGRGHGDEQLTQWAAKTLPKVQMHLDRARELQQKVAK